MNAWSTNINTTQTGSKISSLDIRYYDKARHRIQEYAFAGLKQDSIPIFVQHILFIRSDMCIASPQKGKFLSMPRN